MSLEDIREKKHGKGVYIIIGFLLIGMAGFGTSQFGTGSNTGDAAVLSAGDATISQAEYQNTLRTVQQRNPEMTADDAKNVALSVLQQRVALSHYVNQYPLAASNQQMDSMISQNPAFFDNGQFSDEAFRRVTRVASEVYRKSLSKDIAMQSLQQAIANTGVISQAEAQPYIDLGRLNRDILLAKLPRSQFSATVDDSEIQAYYEANKAKYMTDEMISIAYLDLNPDEIAANIAVSDAEILAAAQPAREAKYHVFSDKQSAQNVYEKYQAGSDIQSLQAAFAQNIEDSGELGEVAAVATADSLIPQSAIDAIYALNSVGDVTAPMVIDETVYLFELSGKADTVISDSEKFQAKAELQAKKAAPKIAQLHETLNTAVFDTQSPTLDSIATATGLTLVQANDLSSNQGQGILAIPELLAAIQASDKKTNQLQEPVSIGERVIIYRLTKVTEPQQKPLTSVKAPIKQAVMSEKITQQMNAAAEQLIKQTQADGLEAAAVTANYPTQRIKQFSGAVDNKALLDPVAAMMIARQLPKLGNDNARVIVSPMGDSYVYVTTDIRLGDDAADSTESATIVEALSGQIGQLELTRFVQSVTAQSDIRLNPSLLNN